MSHSSFTQEQLPSFQTVDPAHIVPQLKTLLDTNRRSIARLLSQTEPFSWKNLLQPLEEMSDELSKFWSPIAHLHSVSETKELREAYHTALPLLTEYHTEISQNESLFNAIASIPHHPEFEQLSEAQKKIIHNDLRDFRLAGIHLPAETKERLRVLNKELSQLMTTFSEHLLDATQAFTLSISDPSELAGLPPQALQLAEESAAQRNLKGYLFTLEYPSYSSAIRFLDNRELRKTLYTAYTTRASDQGPHAGKWDNSKVMERITAVRMELARLIGFKNYAEYSLATKMAKETEEVLHFLRDLLIRSQTIAHSELEEVKKLALELDHISEIETWDLAYYSEKLREKKFSFSQEDLRVYFPIDKVLNGMFAIVSQLYGLSIREEKHLETWHPQVQFFSVYDEGGNLRGGFYTDLYARGHKKDGAWMDECRVRHLLENGTVQHPVAFLTCNFMRPTADHPALLTHDDVLTLFHEFGHCLHHILTKVDFPSVAGINGVPWDAVEFPSQFMENFCWEKETLQLISSHHETGATLPDDLFSKMLAAKHFQTGLSMVRQIEFALFDFLLHLEFTGQKEHEIQSILDKVRAETALLIPPKFSRFQNSFSHVFAGAYAAGYYSYKWAEVLSADAYALFEEQGLLNPNPGRSFMQNILEVGGVRDPRDSFIAFRGRKPTIDALLRHSGIA